MTMANSSIRRLAQFTALSVAFIKVTAQAQTSLFVPGFDPQPISADVVGVDGEGRTTWALQAGQATNAADIGIPPSVTITLVDGPSDAGYTVAFTGDGGAPVTVAYDCILSSSQAVCAAFAGGESGTVTMTRDPFLVQVGTTAASATPTTNAAATTSGASSSRTDARSGGPSQTMSGSGARATNGGEKPRGSVTVLGFVAAAGLLYAM